MSRAREILRSYLERRSGLDAAAAESIQEENLRRLLRHVAAERQPPESLEAHLLRAMPREARQASARRSHRWLSRPAWMVLAPAAALACAALATVWHARAGRQVAAIPHLTTPYSGSAHPTARPTQPRRARPVIGLVIMGELQRRHPGLAQWEPVDSGSKIELDDTVSTGPGASASIVFLDTSISRLSPNSTVQYTGPGRGPAPRPSRVRLARGETWSVVEKGGPPFVVETRTAKAVVQGTEFGVGVDSQERTMLRVKEGKVALQAGGTTVMVGPGMQAMVLPGHPPLPPVPMASSPRPRPATRHPARRPAFPPASVPSEEPAGSPSDRIIERTPPPGTPAPADAPDAGSDTDDRAPSRPFTTSR